MAASGRVKMEGDRTGFYVDPTRLPEPERLAVLELAAAKSDLALGTYDEHAQATFLAAPPSMREAATRKAKIAAFLLTDAAHSAWPDKVRRVQDRFGATGNPRRTLMRVLDTVEGVDPINFAPALLAGYRSASVAIDVDPEAWRFFLGTIQRAAPTFSLKAAWRDVRDVGTVRGWAWPSYPTIYRRWTALAETDRRALRFGREDAARSLTQPALRDKTTIAPLQWVSLDGRTQDFWADWGDGRPIRTTMLILGKRPVCLLCRA